MLSTIIRDGINHNRATYFFGFLKVGDMDDLVADLVPRPYMMTNGSGDPIFPIDGVRAIVTKAEKSYTLQGAAGNFKSLIFPGPHGRGENPRLPCEAALYLQLVAVEDLNKSMARARRRRGCSGCKSRRVVTIFFHRTVPNDVDLSRFS